MTYFKGFSLVLQKPPNKSMQAIKGIVWDLRNTLIYLLAFILNQWTNMDLYIILYLVGKLTCLENKLLLLALYLRIQWELLMILSRNQIH